MRIGATEHGRHNGYNIDRMTDIPGYSNKMSALPQNRRLNMSALGQKQTFAVQKGMSGLLAKADIRRPTQISAEG